MPAANSAAIPMPARISRADPPPSGPIQATTKTSVAAVSPNTSAPTGSSATDPGKASRMRIAPKPEPAVTPITSGEASGLPSAPCSIAPATPSAAPTRIASTVRGSLSCSTICFSGPSSAWPSSASTTVLSGTSIVPSASDAPTPASSAATVTATTRTRRPATSS